MRKPRIIHGVTAQAPSDWLPVDHVINLLGVTRETLYRWRKAGRLESGKAYRNGKSIAVFNPQHVAVIRSQRPEIGQRPADIGDKTARAFIMFDEGANHRSIIIATGLLPDQIANLYDQWLDLGGAKWVITESARAVISRYVGPVGSIADLIERLRVLHEVKIEATVPAHASDEEIEESILRALDCEQPVASVDDARSQSAMTERAA